MKKVLFILLVLPVFCFSQNKDGLTLIFKGPDFDVYMDADVKKQSVNTFMSSYVRIIHDSDYGRKYKLALAKELKNGEIMHLKYNRQTILIDIKNKRIKTLQITYFNEDDIPIDSRKFDSWDYISPNTFSDIVYRSTKDIIANSGI